MEENRSTRFSWFTVAVFLAVALALVLLPRSTAVPAQPSPLPSSTVTLTATLEPFVAFPTRPAKSPTALPLQPTHTAVPTRPIVPIPSETLVAEGTATLQSFPSTQPAVPAGSRTPPVPIALSKDGKPVACTKGPAVEFVVKTTFKAAQIIGKDPTGRWWYLAVYQGNNVFINCWVFGTQVDTAGDLSALLVNEPEGAEITRVEIIPPGQTAAAAQAALSVDCGSTPVTLRFTGRIFADGPIENLGYTWDAGAQLALPPGQTRIAAWNAPAELAVDVPLPAQAGAYTLRLRSLYPMEAVAELRLEVTCK